MKFQIESQDHNGGCYFIMINKQIAYDSEICEFLNISLKEYQNCLLRFNGFRNLHDIYFHDKSDCLKALDCLNEKYGVLLALMEEK